MSGALLVDRSLETALARLHPYVAHALGRGAELARRFHATELGPEHLLASLLEDEDCAATRIVLFAFCDPETIAVEALALAPGVMVVSAERCVPFSALGRRALEDAREEAVRRSHDSVEGEHLVLAALRHLDPGLVAELEAAGLDARGLLADRPASATPLEAEGPRLRPLAPATRRAVSAAGRLSARLGRRSVAPAHLLLGCLESEEDLARRAGLSAHRCRLVVQGRDADERPVEGPSLPVTPVLAALLDALPDRGDTGAILRELVRAGSEELRALLGRQKITPALLERAAESFEDPDPPGHR